MSAGAQVASIRIVPEFSSLLEFEFSDGTPPPSGGGSSSGARIFALTRLFCYSTTSQLPGANVSENASKATSPRPWLLKCRAYSDSTSSQETRSAIFTQRFSEFRRPRKIQTNLRQFFVLTRFSIHLSFPTARFFSRFSGIRYCIIRTFSAAIYSISIDFIAFSRP